MIAQATTTNRIQSNGNNNGTRKPRKPKAACPANLQLLVDKMEQLRAEAKARYQEADVLEMQLINHLQAHGPTIFADGRRLSLKDNFIDNKTGLPRNVAYKPCGVRRFEIVCQK